MLKYSLVLVLCAFSLIPAFGQSGELSVSGGVSRFNNQTLGDLGTPGSPKITLTNGFHLAFRFTWNQGSFFGHEIGYAYNRSKIRFGNDPSQDVATPIHQGLYDFLVYATKEGSKVRPFAAGGAQFNSFFPPGTSVYYGNQVTKFGINYGGGLKFKLGPIWGARLDFRQCAMPKPFDFPNQSGWMRQTQISVGVSFNF